MSCGGETTPSEQAAGSSPDMVQEQLALVVVLLEPGLELGWGNHQQRVEGLSQRCLEQESQS